MISILMSEQWTETSRQEVQHSLEGKNNIDSVTWTRSTFSHEATCCQCVFRVTNLPPLDLLRPKATFKYKKNRRSLIEDYQQNLIVTSLSKKRQRLYQPRGICEVNTVRCEGIPEALKNRKGMWRYSQGIRKKVIDSGQ